MFCQFCGGALVPGARFCHGCGAILEGAPTAASEPPDRQPPGGGPTRRRAVVKILVLVVCALFLMFATGAAAIFFSIRYALKSSGAYQTAVSALKQSPAASDALGEITDIGLPMGSISTEVGGTGSASLSMSVKGTKTRGRYYATLVKANDLWRLTSGRVELENGRWFNVEIKRAPPGLESVRLAPPAEGRPRFLLAKSWL